MREVTDPLGSFRSYVVPKALAGCPDSSFCLAIGLVVVCGGHVEVDSYVCHKLHSKARGELGVSIRNDRGRVAMD